MITKFVMVGMLGSLVLGASSLRANVILDLVDFGQGGTIGNATSSGGTFAVNTATTVQTGLFYKHHSGVTLNNSAEFAVTAESTGSKSAVGLSCWFNGSPWSYSVTSGSQNATLSAKGDTFSIGNVGGALLTGSVNSGTITSTSISKTQYLNTMNVYITGIGISKGSTLPTDLSSLLSTGNGLDLTLNWYSTVALNGLSGKSIATGAFNGVTIGSLPPGVVSAVPETTTVVAGAAALGMLALMRVRRAQRQN